MGFRTSSCVYKQKFPRDVMIFRRIFIYRGNFFVYSKIDIPKKNSAVIHISIFINLYILILYFRVFFLFISFMLFLFFRFILFLLLHCLYSPCYSLDQVLLFLYLCDSACLL